MDAAERQLLDETVGSLGAVSGAVEIAGSSPRAPMRTVGNWTGNTHLAAEVLDGDRVIARILLGPRANGDEYDTSRQVRFIHAVEVVSKALDKIPKRDSAV